VTSWSLLVDVEYQQHSVTFLLLTVCCICSHNWTQFVYPRSGLL